MDATATQPQEALEFDDVEFTAQSEQDWTTIPEDDYILEVVGYRVVDKPAYVIEREALQKKKPLEAIDPQQWEWTWEVAEGEFKGEQVKDWTNRTWHEKSSAGIYAAALAGLEKYDRAAMVDKGYGSMRALMNKRIKAFVTETETKEGGKFRNYIKNPRRLSPGRPRADKKPISDSTSAVPYQELPRDIFEK